MKEWKILLIAFILVGFLEPAFAQRPYFVYLQAEDGKPFFVQLNRKNYSSSSIGHLILPGLVNGTYQFQLGYNGQNTLQDYSVVVENKDQGFLIKRLEPDSSFAIVDLQTASVQKNGEIKKATEEAERQKVLAAEAAAAKKLEEEKLLAEKVAQEQALAVQKSTQDSLNAIQAQKDSVKTAEKSKPVTDTVANETVTGAEIEKKGEAMETGKTGEKAAAAGAGVAAASGSQEGKEVKEEKLEKEKKDEKEQKDGKGNVVVPAVVTAGVVTAAVLTDKKEKGDSLMNEMPSVEQDTLSGAVKQSPPPAAAPVFLDMVITMPGDSSSNQNPGDSSQLPAADSVQKIPADSAVVAVGDSTMVKMDSVVVMNDSTVAKAAVVVANPNCKGDATDSDVELVSMIIKGEKDPEDALEIIKKTVKVKCVTTVQVRRLVELFEQDEHRYGLLDIAYRYTSDRQHFSALADLLKDPYYLNRFKAMLQ